MLQPLAEDDPRALTAPVDRALYIAALGHTWKLGTVRHAAQAGAYCLVCGARVVGGEHAYVHHPRLSGSRYDRRRPRLHRIHATCAERAEGGARALAEDTLRCPA